MRAHSFFTFACQRNESRSRERVQVNWTAFERISALSSWCCSPSREKRVHRSASHILENRWGHLTSWQDTFPRIMGTCCCCCCEQPSDYFSPPFFFFYISCTLFHAPTIIFLRSPPSPVSSGRSFGKFLSIHPRRFDSSGRKRK